MAKKLYFAPAASGKTGTMISMAREKARALQAEVRVCVPTSLQARSWRERLAGAGGAIGVHVLTFDQIAAVCLDVAGEPYTELSEPVLHRLLRTKTDQLPLSHFAPIKSKPGFLQATNKVITELKSGRIKPDDFSEAVIELGDEPRLHELASIYSAYQEQLQDRSWADRVGLQWLAAEVLESWAADARLDWPLLIVDGFDDFTQSQLALLQQLADRVDEFVITLSQAERVDYPRYRNTQQEVEEAFDIKGEPLPAAGTSAGQLALHHLARHIFALAPAEPVAAGGAFALREAPDRTAEVRTALRWLKQRIVWENMRPDQVALLARNITPYRSLIQQIAAEFGLPIRLVDGSPLQQSPVIAALLELLRLYLPAAGGGEPNLPRRQLIDAWRSPYFSWGGEELSISAEDADALDTLAREQRVIRGLAQWQAAFSAAMAAGDHKPDKAEEREDLVLARAAVSRLQKNFNHFLELTQPPTEANSMREFVSWLERLIGYDPQADDPDISPAACSLKITTQAQANPETAEADMAALRTLKEILRGLLWAEEAVEKETQVKFSSFFNELSGAIAATQFTLPARDGRQELLVANVIDARGLSFQAAVVMGLSEGEFPATIGEDPFLRDTDRQQLLHLRNFQLEPSTQSAEQEFFYEAITRPREKLLLTRPVLADNGAEWVASPFWEAARRLLATEVEQIPSEVILPLPETASWAEWWETVAGTRAGVTGAEKRNPAAWEQIETAAEVWEARLAAQPSIWEGDLGSQAAALAAEHGPRRIWSASRLESYRTCGFLFYVQYGLKLASRPEPAEGLDARQLGSLYHRIFEKVTSSDQDTMDETAVRERVTAVAQPILDAAPKQEGFRETPWWAQTRLEIIENVTKSVLALAGGAYEFFRAELSFGIDNDPLVIKDGADELRLRGFIDRVDKNKEGQLRIIDYKLGGPYSFKPRAFAEGKKLQLPLYALAAQAVGPVADGFYWHFRQEESSAFQLATADGGVAGAIETAVAYAWEAVHQIRAGQFAPRPPDDGCPAYCPAARFCWHYSPKSW